MCGAKHTVWELEKSVVLCCDQHRNDDFHYDQLNNIIWQVPVDKIPAKKVTVPPLRERYVHTGPPDINRLAHVS